MTALLVFLVLVMGCKTSSDVGDSGSTYRTSLSILQLMASAQYMGEQTQLSIGESKGSILVSLSGSPSPDHPFSQRYKYSVRARLGTGPTGEGAEMVDVELTFYKNSTVVGTTKNGEEAFMASFLKANEGAYTNTLTTYSSEVFTSVKMKVGYRTASVASSTESSANFPDPGSIPYISHFIVAKTTLGVGEQTTMGWKVLNTTGISITRNGHSEFNNLAAEDLIVINPSASGQEFNTYRLIAKNGSNEEYKEIQVRVTYPNVEYRVFGVPEASIITMSGASGSTVQYANVKLPYTYQISNAHSGDFLYVSAQNSSNAGCIWVEIYKNNSFYKYASSCGAYVIATVSGTY